jgi:hypothetical protein
VVTGNGAKIEIDVATAIRPRNDGFPAVNVKSTPKAFGVAPRKADAVVACLYLMKSCKCHSERSEESLICR